MTKNAERREKFKQIGRTISALDIEWRIARGESPNPWGVAKSGGYDVQQIITRHRLSRLERRSLAGETADAAVGADVLGHESGLPFVVTGKAK